MTSENARYPTIAMSSQRVNFGVTRTLPERNRNSAAANVATVARTAWKTMSVRFPPLPTVMVPNARLMPPRNRPWATV
ncbi:Uncharacterised protein [Mycobacteroides abscessus]|nr:Uncharacterised protein [Mycobacteroides abscessus]